ncbi:helix-turn-helix domain-containing protein [Streptomyces sp. NPDC014894]|uniref:helix-turn-helix domain-containing protein n=1 Tax=Streptomyces sp. NPDC014894 TaxID=3364931 RepID=UPI0036F886AE
MDAAPIRTAGPAGPAPPDDAARPDEAARTAVRGDAAPRPPAVAARDAEPEPESEPVPVPAAPAGGVKRPVPPDGPAPGCPVPPDGPAPGCPVPPDAVTPYDLPRLVAGVLDHRDEHGMLWAALAAIAATGPFAAVAAYTVDRGRVRRRPPPGPETPEDPSGAATALRGAVAGRLDRLIGALDGHGGHLALDGPGASGTAGTSRTSGTSGTSCGDGELVLRAVALRHRDRCLGYLVVRVLAAPSARESADADLVARETAAALAALGGRAEGPPGADGEPADPGLGAAVLRLAARGALHEALARAAASGEGEAGILRILHEHTGLPARTEDRFGNLRLRAGPDDPDGLGDPNGSGGPDSPSDPGGPGDPNGSGGPSDPDGPGRDAPGPGDRSRPRPAGAGPRARPGPRPDGSGLRARPGPRPDGSGPRDRPGPPGAVRERERLTVPVAMAGDPLGLLALEDPERRAGDPELAALEQTALVLAPLLAHERRLAELEPRLRHDLVESLISGTAADDVFVRAAGLGHDLHRPHRVAVLRWTGAIGAAAVGDAVERAAARLRLDVLAGSRDTSTVVLLAGRDTTAAGGLYEAVSELLGTAAGAVGVGGPCEGFADLPHSYEEAVRALAVRRGSHEPHGSTGFEELGLVRMMGAGDDEREADRFVREWLGPLLEYDARHRTDFTATLSSYLESGGSYDATAEALHIHRSTVRYRLQRIREVTGHDLGHVDTRLNLHVASRIHRVLDRPR